jgi:hypothetical protein
MAMNDDHTVFLESDLDTRSIALPGDSAFREPQVIEAKRGVTPVIHRR